MSGGEAWLPAMTCFLILAAISLAAVILGALGQYLSMKDDGRY